MRRSENIARLEMLHKMAYKRGQLDTVSFPELDCPEGFAMFCQADKDAFVDCPYKLLDQIMAEYYKGWDSGNTERAVKR